MKLNMERATALYNALTILDTDENADLSFPTRMKIGANLNALRPNVEVYQKALRAFTLKMNKDHPTVDQVIAAEADIERIGKHDVDFPNIMMMEQADFKGDTNKKLTGTVLRDIQPILSDGTLKEESASEDLLNMLSGLAEGKTNAQ